MKKQKVFPILFSIFAVVGIGLMLVAVLIYVNGMRFRQSAVRVTGEIVDIVTNYHGYHDYDDYDRNISHEVFVTYTFEGETYERVLLKEYNSNMYEGGSITLLCDPENPRKVKTETGFYLVVMLLGGIGMVFFCVGIIPLIFSARKKKRKEYLLVNGRILHATVERVDIDTTLAINGQNPYVIYCSWEDEYADIQYRFKSDNLWTDPSFVFDRGSEINVYVDGNDFSKYYVDAERVLSQKVVDFT